MTDWNPVDAGAATFTDFCPVNARVVSTSTVPGVVGTCQGDGGAPPSG